MKLLLENWQKYIAEDWQDTSWEDDGEKITIGEVVDYLGDKTSMRHLTEWLQPAWIIRL